MTPDEIAVHLVADWLPGVPTSASVGLMGWPSYLLETEQYPSGELLVLNEEAGRTERQWKGMLSWMLGVAGARHILAKERYRWIAPLSAFYPEAVQPVRIGPLPTAYPRYSIVASRAQRPATNLRPDYLAIRQRGTRYEWAVAEAKGTSASLKSMTSCPKNWHNQSRNTLLTVDGTPITFLRHLVIATRVNPNAQRPYTRRLQLRVWDNTEDSLSFNIPSSAAVDIVATHLYGFLRNLRLLENANAIALSTEVRSEVNHSASQEMPAEQGDLLERADVEFQRHAQTGEIQSDLRPLMVVNIETDSGSIEFEFSEPLKELIQSFQRAANYAFAAEALERAESQLDDWEREARLGDRDGIVLPFGVRVRLPDEFGRAY